MMDEGLNGIYLRGKRYKYVNKLPIKYHQPFTFDGICLCFDGQDTSNLVDLSYGTPHSSFALSNSKQSPYYMIQFQIFVNPHVQTEE